MSLAMPAPSAEAAQRLYGITYRGTVDIYGHYARPGMARTYQATVRSSRDPRDWSAPIPRAPRRVRDTTRS